MTPLALNKMPRVTSRHFECADGARITSRGNAASDYGANVDSAAQVRRKPSVR